MIKFNGYEITAINSNGLWYAYVSKNDKTVFSDSKGVKDRDEAIKNAEAHVVERDASDLISNG